LDNSQSDGVFAKCRLSQNGQISPIQQSVALALMLFYKA